MTSPDSLSAFDRDERAAIVRGVDEGKPYEQVIAEVTATFRPRWMKLIRAKNKPEEVSEQNADVQGAADTIRSNG
jgi:hypothetical protein